MPMKPTRRKDQELFDIRCPFKRKDKYGIVHDCRYLCCRVTSGSAGEAWCRVCKITFQFQVENGNAQQFISVKKENAVQ